MWVSSRLFFKYITHACGVNFQAPFTHPQASQTSRTENGIRTSK
jgi:hypothetical protein